MCVGGGDGCISVGLRLGSSSGSGAGVQSDCSVNMGGWVGLRLRTGCGLGGLVPLARQPAGQLLHAKAQQQRGGQAVAGRLTCSLFPLPFTLPLPLFVSPLSSCRRTGVPAGAGAAPLRGGAAWRQLGGAQHPGRRAGHTQGMLCYSCVYIFVRLLLPFDLVYQLCRGQSGRGAQRPSTSLASPATALGPPTHCAHALATPPAAAPVGAQGYMLRATALLPHTRYSDSEWRSYTQLSAHQVCVCVVMVVWVGSRH